MKTIIVLLSVITLVFSGCLNTSSICDCLHSDLCGFCDGAGGCRPREGGELACQQASGTWTITSPSTCTAPTTPPSECGLRKTLCECIKGDACGLCDAGTNGGCKNRTGGAEACHSFNGTWVITSDSCTVTPTPTPAPVECAGKSLCDCLHFDKCGFCDGGLGCKNREGGEAACTTAGGKWTLTSTTCVTPTPAPNPCAVATICECTKGDACGWCTGTKEGKIYAYCKAISSAGYCSEINGTWSAGHQTRCDEPSPTIKYHTAEVTGKINATVDATTSAVVESVIQKLVAEKLGVEPSKVLVVATFTKNTDGTFNFNVVVKVEDKVVPDTTFKTSVDSILSSSVEQNLTTQGVNAQGVNINSNPPVRSFAGKIFVSLLLSLIVILF